MRLRKQATQAPDMAPSVSPIPATTPGAVMSTVFRADGSILLQNPASRAGFAAPDCDGASAFLRHFVSPDEGTALLARMRGDETVRRELAVHTTAGIHRLRIVASPLASAESAERLFLLVESAFTPGMLKSDEETFRDYAEAAADWFWEMDTSLRFSFMSESTQLPAANSVEILIGQRLTDIAATDDDGGDWQSLADQLEARLPFRDIRVRCRDDKGGTHHLSFSGIPVSDDSGQFRGYRGIGRDLTLLVRAEKSAAIAQNRLMDAIESIPECFMLLDAEDRLVLCNSRYREVNAAVAAWLVLGTALADIDRVSIERGAVRPVSGALDQRFKRAAAKVGECQLGDRWFQISERRTHDGGSVVVQTEITALKRREQELAEKSALLRATLDNMRQGMIVLDDQLRLKLWNHRICEIFDIPPAFLQASASAISAVMRLLAERGGYGTGDPETLMRHSAWPTCTRHRRRSKRLRLRAIASSNAGFRRCRMVGLIATYLRYFGPKTH